MAAVTIVDVVDEETFALIPLCADPRFDHRTCDYWEDADRGSKAARPSWLERTAVTAPPSRPKTGNPFLDDAAERATFNPFAAASDALADNPFAPKPKARPAVVADAPRKLALL